MTIAELDGEPLDTSSAVGWALRVGSDPHRQVFTMERGAALRVHAAARPGESILRIQPPGYAELLVEGLTVVGPPGPGLSPEQSTLEVADFREAFPDRHVVGRFNIRRRTGEQRRLSPGLPAAVQPLVPDLGFAAFSLVDPGPPGLKWELPDTIRNIANKILITGEQFELRALPPRSLPIENLTIDDPGNAALQRLAGYTGGLLGFYVDRQKVLVAFDRGDGSEGEVVGVAGGGGALTSTTRDGGQAPPSIQGPPTWVIQDRSLDRAIEVQPLFSRLVELRFDFQEVGAPSDRGEREALDLQLENVLPCPDPTLDIPAVGGKKARTVLQGAWITFEEALAAWNLIGWPVSADGLNLFEIRSFWFSDSMESEFVFPRGDLGGVRARRIQAVRQHFRRTFRIKKATRDRLGQLFPIRAAVSDVENAVLAPAEVYVDTAVWLTGQGGQPDADVNPLLIVNNIRANVDAPGVIINAKIPDMSPAQATVVIRDQDEGVITLVFKVSDYGDQAVIAPSAVDEVTVPTNSLADDNLFTNRVALVEGYEMSLIISTVPVAPNSDRQLHRVAIQPSEVEALIGSVGPARGPVREVRVQPMNLRAMARFQWDDDRSAEFRNAFRFEVDDPRDPEVGAAGVQDIAFGKPANADEVQQIALAHAARHYARNRDHVEGILATGWDPSIEPKGSITAVAHSLAPTGEAITTVLFPRDLPAQSPWAFLPEWVRQIVLAEVLP